MSADGLRYVELKKFKLMYLLLVPCTSCLSSLASQCRAG